MYDHVSVPWLVFTTAVCVIGVLIVYFYRQIQKPRRDDKSKKHIAFENIDFRTRMFYPFVNPKGVMNLRSLRAEMDLGLPWIDVRATILLEKILSDSELKCNVGTKL